MEILIVSATVKEIAPFLNKYRNSLNSWNADVMISGIGMTSTAYQLTRQLYLKRPDIVIQAGVAGCFDKNFSSGSVVIVSKDTIADQSVIELKKMKTLFDLKLVPHNQFPFKNGWLENPNKALLRKTKLKAVKGISVNQISTSKRIINFYKETFSPSVESMEGAALHFTCIMEQIPFVQIRSISNYIGERNKKNWNMKDSINNLNTALISLLDVLTSEDELKSINKKTTT